MPSHQHTMIDLCRHNEGVAIGIVLELSKTSLCSFYPSFTNNYHGFFFALLLGMNEYFLECLMESAELLSGEPLYLRQCEEGVPYVQLAIETPVALKKILATIVLGHCGQPQYVFGTNLDPWVLVGMLFVRANCYKATGEDLTFLCPPPQVALGSGMS